MDDLISRQMVIDTLNIDAELLKRALDDIYVVGAERAEYEWGLGLIESCISDVKELPSAELEAKPPKWVAEDRYVKNIFAVFPHCPQCNADITTGQCYCMICGQHIDWSEDDG